MSTTFFNDSSLFDLNFREKRLANQTNKVYQDSIMGNLGFSNQQSAGTLQNSTRAYSMGSALKDPFKPYYGIDSFDYQPVTSFIDKKKYQSIQLQKGQNIKGTAIGKGEKSDFTKEARKIPAPNSYELNNSFQNQQTISKIMGVKNNLVKGATLGLSQKYDFTKSQQGIPGANRYQPEQIIQYERQQKYGVGLGFGQKSDFTKETRKIPGPNVYEKHSDFLSPEQRKQKLMRSGKGGEKGGFITSSEKYDFTQFQRYNPAPNQYKNYNSEFSLYDSKEKRIFKGIGGMKGTSLGKGEKSDFTKDKRFLPGPSDYQSRQKLTSFQSQRSQFLDSLRYNRQGLQKGGLITKSQRFDFTKDTKGFPGPGSYGKPILQDQYKSKLIQHDFERRLKTFFQQNNSSLTQ